MSPAGANVIPITMASQLLQHKAYEKFYSWCRVGFLAFHTRCLNLVTMLSFVLNLSACTALYSLAINFAINIEIFRLGQYSPKAVGWGVCRTFQSIPVLKWTVVIFNSCK